MADAYLNAQQQNIARLSDGSAVRLRATRDGAAIQLPWFVSLVMEGRVFQAAAPQPLTITALTIMTTYADASKTVYADIPDGTAFIPVEVHCSQQAAGGLGHYFGFISDTLNGTGGTETAITPINYRKDAPIASGATCAHTASSEVDTVTGTEISLFHRSINSDVDALSFEPSYLWTVANAGIAPIGLDAGSINLVVYNETSGTGLGQISWIELTESAFT